MFFTSAFKAHLQGFCAKAFAPKTWMLPMRVGNKKLPNHLMIKEF